LVILLHLVVDINI